MENRYGNSFAWVVLFVLMVFGGGCSAIKDTPQVDKGPVDTTRLLSETTPEIEALYLAWLDFDQSRKDLKFLERGFLFDPDDRQLGYLQKIGLYLQDASVRMKSSWDQLSVFQYIRPEWMRDYLTLAGRTLTDSVEEIAYDQRFVSIYAEFMANSAIRKEIDRTQNQLEKAVDALKRVHEKILPYTQTGTGIQAHFSPLLVFQG